MPLLQTTDVPGAGKICILWCDGRLGKASMRSRPVDEFAILWEAGAAPPDVFAFLRQHADAAFPDRLDVLLADQAQRWRRGQELAVEEYLARIPGLSANQEARLQLAVGEFQARLSSETIPDIHEFTLRFSDLRDTLRSKLSDGRSGVRGAVCGGRRQPAPVPRHAASAVRKGSAG
jgi:hypothetical protein